MTRSPAARAVRSGVGPVLLACGLAAAGCSSNSAPPWASALGSGVTVTAPAQVSPGHGSPGAAIAGVFAAISSKNYAAECNYVEPDKQAACKTGVASITSSTAPSFQNADIGYVATDGDKALVGTTGKFCIPDQTPECYTNNDPAAIFSSKKPFSTLWTDANKAGSTNAYSLAPCTKIGGQWYLYESS